MPKTISFNKLFKKNNFKKIRRKSVTQLRGKRNVAEQFARFTRARARSLQKPAPKNPAKKLGRYGTLRAYKPTSKKFQSGQYHFWKKGLFSRPGQAPFYHDKNAGRFRTLRSIEFYKIQPSQISIGNSVGSTRGAKVIAYRVGPTYKRSRHTIPIPMLHEQGGTITLSKGTKQTHQERNGVYLRRRSSERAQYAARPYMAPAAKEARNSLRRKMNNLAGMRPNRIKN